MTWRTTEFTVDTRALPRLRVPLRVQPPQREEANDDWDREGDASQHDHIGESGIGRYSERSEATSEGRLLHTDSSGNRRDEIPPTNDKNASPRRERD
jgi:hypothetical protein